MWFGRFRGKKKILNLVPWIKYKTDYLNEEVVSAKSLVNSSSKNA